MSGILTSLRAISDPTRLRLLALLSDEELSVAELQSILGMAQSRISASLALLRREGLVRDRRVGKNSFYTARGLIKPNILEILSAAAEELPDAGRDRAALELAMDRRKDTAAAYFEKLAGKFGRTYIPGRSWQALAHGLLALQPARIIVDLGAGEGTLSQLLAGHAEKVIAIDNSPAMVDFGSRIARENGYANLEYRLGDIESPPVDDDSADLALFSQALHHASTPQKAINEAYRIVRAGGRILILDLASHSHEQARELYAHIWLGFGEIELREMLGASGFVDIRTRVVARERKTPHFQTVMAVAAKPDFTRT